jgi:hypothetical protein
MKTFKFQEVLDFIKATPDETHVNFGNSCNDEGECGCLMVQFGRFKGLEFQGVSYNGDTYYTKWLTCIAEIEDFPDTDILSYCDAHHGIHNFGELKEKLAGKL